MGQITDEMVEAGAKAAYEVSAVGATTPWSGLTIFTRDYFRKQARACLEAALRERERESNPQRCEKCGEWPMIGDPHECLRLPFTAEGTSE